LLDAFNDAKAKDPKIYESIQAVKDNKVIALPGNYTTSKGLEVVPDFVKLIDLLSEKLGK
jgi:iron complex transport system substrate-binding protein